MADFGTVAGVIQVVQMSSQLLAAACDFCITRRVIDETSRGLQDELEMLLLICQTIKKFLDPVGWLVSSSNGVPTSDQNAGLLKKALTNLNTDVEIFNRRVEELLKHKSGTARTLSRMWNRARWSDLNGRIFSHKLSILIAFDMLRIDPTQKGRLGTLVTFQKVTGNMKTLRKRHSARASRCQSRKGTDSNFQTHPTDEFYHEAESAYRRLSGTVNPTVTWSQSVQPTSESRPQSMVISPGTQTDLALPGNDDQLTTSGPAALGLLHSVDETAPDIARDESLHCDNMLDKAILSAAAVADREHGDQMLAAVEQERRPDTELSQDVVDKLEEAQNYFNASLRRMSILESKYDVELPARDFEQVSKAAAKVHELCKRPQHAINTLLRLLSRELEETVVIRTELEIARLAFEAGKREDAIGLAHESYDAAKSMWVWRSIGIPEMIASLEMLVRIYQDDDTTLAYVYRKEAEEFVAWNWIQQRHPSFTKYLREHRTSPLAYVASKGYDSEVRELIRINPALIRYKNASGATPLIVAAHEKHVDVVKVLLENHPVSEVTNVDEADSHGDTALHAAQLPPSLDSVQKHPNWADKANHITKLLLQHDAKARLPNNLGQLPLHIAAEQGNCQSMRSFLQHNSAELKTQDNGGSTPLHIAIEKGRLEMVELLLRKDADTMIKDNEGRNALDLARDPNLDDLRHNQIIELLKSEQRKMRSISEDSSVSGGRTQSAYRRLTFFLNP